MNIRGMVYDTGRALFRSAVRLKVGALIQEIARSEIAYTDQRPAEYVAVMLAAALREGFRGPIFIQGDHFQVNAKKFAVDPVTEVNGVKQLAREAIAAGFYNIDVDTSTLVDLGKKSHAEQQKLNYEVGVDILKEVRAAEPQGVTISVGGEIGEVGTQNSTVEELRAFMDGFLAALPADIAGLSKISVQSGTSHGGVVLEDGSIADVKLDLDTLELLSRIAREEYGLAGAVQHGASTLPEDAFNNFPARETAEIHLATNFQNMLFDQIPDGLRAEIYAWIRDNAKDERKPTDTDEQFF
jgi:fructose-bisphosphate aldolase, class II